MNVDDFDFELDPERIAQEPLPQRDASKLMVLDRVTGALRHHRFHELPELLRPGDLLVLNDTRVIPARLDARRVTGGRVEILLLEPMAQTGPPVWRCLTNASKPVRTGTRLMLDGGVTAEVVGEADAARIVRFDTDEHGMAAALDRHGRIPLPPYIRREAGDARDAADRVRYQTVYARAPGAVAAPTAGLHFTPELLRRVAARGVATTTLTLHTGEGTFLPVRTAKVEEHRMAPERFEIPAETAAAVAEARERNGRVVAVGTTVVRALEANATAERGLRSGSGRSDLFIYPGFEFRVVDALVTNFHLPRSTLLMLVAAFAGREPVLAAYRTALESGYRYFSYGDAMLIG